MKRLVNFNSTLPSTPKIRRALIFDAVIATLQCALIALLCLAAVALWVFAPVGIDGNSMQNSYFDGETVIVRKAFIEPSRGDVVVIKRAEGYLIKRVVAKGGDEVGFVEKGGKVYLYVDDGSGFKKIDEPYIKEDMINASNVFIKITPHASEEALIEKGGFVVPKDGLYLLGDNRNHSGDSRSYGVFYEKDLYGVVVGKDEDFKILSSVFSLFIKKTR
jgi:signal peptidase I